MSRLTRDGTAKPVLRDQVLTREERGQGNIDFPCSADHVQEWEPYPVDPYPCLAICVAIQTYMVIVVVLSAHEFSAASLAPFSYLSTFDT